MNRIDHCSRTPVLVRCYTIYWSCEDENHVDVVMYRN